MPALLRTPTAGRVVWGRRQVARSSGPFRGFPECARPRSILTGAEPWSKAAWRRQALVAAVEGAGFQAQASSSG